MLHSDPIVSERNAGLPMYNTLVSAVGTQVCWPRSLQPLPMMIRVSSSGFLCGVTEVRRGDSRNLAVPVSVSVMFLNVSGFIGVCVD